MAPLELEGRPQGPGDERADTRDDDKSDRDYPEFLKLGRGEREGDPGKEETGREERDVELVDFLVKGRGDERKT